MDKFEYLEFQDIKEEGLNHFGQEGWEIVVAERHEGYWDKLGQEYVDDTWSGLFKRKIVLEKDI